MQDMNPNRRRLLACGLALPILAGPLRGFGTQDAGSRFVLEVVLTFTQYKPDSTGHEEPRPVPAQLCGNSPEAPQWINCRYLLKLRLGQAMRDHVTSHHLPPPPGE